MLELLAADPAAATAVREPVRAVNVHIADSLCALEVDVVRRARTIVDVGSGVGFPGLPLAICLPSASVDLLEGRRRKLAFAQSAIEELGLENVRLVPERAETWAAEAGRCAYEVVLCRAVDTLATVIEYASPLLLKGGLLVAWKGRRDSVEERSGNAAAKALGMEAAGILTVAPFTGSKDRHLYLYEKIGPTPPSVPRRPGMARKRPLA